MNRILDGINSSNDLKKLSVSELERLCGEIRGQLIKRIGAMGGHLGSNLAVIELTTALHYIFDSPKDKIIFDVSHQCYTHKLLTDRKGGLYKNLCLLRESGGKAECNIFRALGFDYYFVKNGNNFDDISRVLAKVKNSSRPVIVHVCTVKGKGYPPAELDMEKWHYTPPFDIESGEPLRPIDTAETYENLTRDTSLSIPIFIARQFINNKRESFHALSLIICLRPVCHSD